MFCTRVAWVCLVCLLLCREEGSSPVFLQLLRRDMGLYEVPLSMFLLGFGIGTMLRDRDYREECESKRAYVIYVPDI